MERSCIRRARPVEPFHPEEYSLTGRRMNGSVLGVFRFSGSWSAELAGPDDDFYRSFQGRFWIGSDGLTLTRGCAVWGV